MGFHSKLRGADLHAPSNELVENNTLSDIAKLKVVALDGMGAIYPQVKIDNPNLYPNFGITQDIIKIGQSGFITVLGFMFEVDTHLWAVGTELYSDTSGNLTTSVLDTLVALVVKQDATHGVLYVTPNAGNTAGWDLTGNLGTNPANNFVGTTDNVGLALRTNDIERVRIDAQGRVGIGTTLPVRMLEVKSHLEAQGSGVQVDSFYLTTSSTSLSQAYAITLDDPSIVKVEFVVSALDEVSGDMGSFKRSGCFFRNASSSQLVNHGWTSDFTAKSNDLLNVSYQLTTTDVIFNVKGSSSNMIKWTGYVIVQTLRA